MSGSSDSLRTLNPTIALIMRQSSFMMPEGSRVWEGPIQVPLSCVPPETL